MVFGVEFSYTANHKLLLSFLYFLLNPLVVLSSQSCHFLDCRYILFLMINVISTLQALPPAHFVQIQEHLLLELILSVVYRN